MRRTRNADAAAAAGAAAAAAAVLHVVSSDDEPWIAPFTQLCQIFALFLS